MSKTARFLVLWGTPHDPEEFDRHYRDVHIPLAKQIPGLRRYMVSRGALPVRGGDPYYCIAELDFDDMDSLNEAFQSEVLRKSFGGVVGCRELITIEPAWPVGLGPERRSRDVWADAAPRTFADRRFGGGSWDIL
jgi:uncharacterized protein (TIGR02118 family)